MAISPNYVSDAANSSRRIGIVFRPMGDPRKLIGLAKLAEDVGLHSIWIVEAQETDSLVLSAALARETTRIKICSGVVNAYSRMPTLISMAALTLSLLADGRFVLGIGSGTRYVGLSGESKSDTPLRRLEETVTFIRQALAGGPVNFRGRVFRSELQFRAALASLNISIPIYVAALGPRTIRLAARIGDGVIFHMFTRDYLERALKIVREELAGQGRRDEELDIVCYLMTIVANDEEEAYNRARHMIATYAAIPKYAEHLRRMGFEAEVENIHSAMRLGIGAAAEQVPRQMVDELAVYGNPRECAEKIVEYARIGVSTPVIYPYMRSGEDYPDAIQKTIERLAPLLI